MTIEYLSVTDVSKRLGISTAAVSAYKLPQPDALIGRPRGWPPQTLHGRAGCQRPSTNGTRNAPAAVSAEEGHANTPNNKKTPLPQRNR